MENTQTLSPSLVVFVIISLILCVWSLVDIFRSSFTRLNKLIWLSVVLFAPFGIFIYIFVGRRMKPLRQGLPPDEAAGGARPAAVRPIGPAPTRGITWPIVATLFAVAVLCVVTYVNVVSLLGRERTGSLLLGAMALVVAILTVLHLRQRRGKP